jgi:hypothetical protein
MMKLELPIPHISKFDAHYILGEFIDHIFSFFIHHPDINLSRLRSALKDIRNDRGTPQKVLRALIKTFERTKTFQNSFNLLDEDVKSKILAFLNGQDVEDVVARTGFDPAPSQSTTKRFQLLDFLNNLLHHGINERKDSDVSTNEDEDEDDWIWLARPEVPRLYEDLGKEMVVEVSAMFTVFVTGSVGVWSEMIMLTYCEGLQQYSL